MKLYKWICETGCGRETYTEKDWKIRPYCSSCGHRDRLVRKGEFHAELTPVSVLGFKPSSNKGEI